MSLRKAACLLHQKDMDMLVIKLHLSCILTLEGCRVGGSTYPQAQLTPVSPTKAEEDVCNIWRVFNLQGCIWKLNL